MPIYFDEKDRVLIDALSLTDEEHRLYPSSRPAQKLHRCIEAMRDLIPLIENIAASKSSDKRQRQTKLLFTPLYSFVEAIIYLMHDIQTNPDTKRGLPPGTDALLTQMENILGQLVPHKRNQLLRVIRNQMSSHIDPTLDPLAARELFNKASFSDIGIWIDACVTILADLLKLPIYIWSCSTKQPNIIGLTAIGGPLITFFEVEDNEVIGIVGAFLMKRDPRYEVFDLVCELINKSRWMFKPSDPQIRGFKIDNPATDSWAQSLKTLKDINKPPP